MLEFLIPCFDVPFEEKAFILELQGWRSPASLLVSWSVRSSFLFVKKRSCLNKTHVSVCLSARGSQLSRWLGESPEWYWSVFRMALSSSGVPQKLAVSWRTVILLGMFGQLGSTFIDEQSQAFANIGLLPWLVLINVGYSNHPCRRHSCSNAIDRSRSSPVEILRLKLSSLGME